MCQSQKQNAWPVGDTVFGYYVFINIRVPARLPPVGRWEKGAPVLPERRTGAHETVSAL